jgi:hypothetical protein
MPIRLSELESIYSYDTTCADASLTDRDEDSEIVAPYYADAASSTTAYGKHAFFDYRLPEYQFDAYFYEHRFCCEETDTGEVYVVKIEPPLKDKDGYADQWFSVYLSKGTVADIDSFFEGTNDYAPQINITETGPVRRFKVDGSWATEAYDSGLMTYTYDPAWSQDAQLYSAETVTSGIFITYDEFGDKVEGSYKRGIGLQLIDASIGLLPQKWELVDPELFECKFNPAPDTGRDDFGSIEVDQWYPGSYCMSQIGYTCSSGTKTITFDFNSEGSDEYRLERHISKVEMEFTYGERIDVAHFHLPAVKIELSDNEAFSGGTTVTKYNDQTMTLSEEEKILGTQRCKFKWTLAAAEMLNTYRYMRISFDTLPDANEKSDAGWTDESYGNYNHRVLIEYLRVHDVTFIEGIEIIKTYERKYNVSVGGHGDFPPHGWESTGSLLYPIAGQGDTVYQRDTYPGGVVGAAGYTGDHTTVGKCRGRVMKSVHIDKERLNPGDVWEYEAEQKKIHDEIALAGSQSMSLRAIYPPDFEQYASYKGIPLPPAMWDCSMTASYVLPLDVVIPRAKYSPGGHYFIQDFENIEVRNACGRHGRVFWRSTENVFEYIYVHNCTDEAACGTPQSFGTIDALTAYARGVGNLLINPLIYLRADMSRQSWIENQMLAGESASTYSRSNMLLYPSIDSLN